MPATPLRLDSTVDLTNGFDAIRAELDLPAAFPPEVLAEAAAAAAGGPATAAAVDLRDVPFFTVDPPHSTDLDQAVSLSRRSGGGFLVRYAIADVAAFVAAGGAVDAEARRRGVTVYLPDGRLPLHPPSLSEAAASLLPDGDRQALVWEIALDDDASPVDVRVGRATVRSRSKLSYADVQRAVDDATADDQLLLLRDVGTLREEQEVARGGVSLPIPEQQVVEIEGRYHLEYRAPLPAERWNAQISLLTGICAARLMLDGGIGVLRTLPPPSAETIDSLRLQARALGVPWPAGTPYGDVIRGLDLSQGPHAAFVVQAARLFRGAGYVAFDGEAPTGAAAEHAAVAAPYAHVTAPLRRLVDRFSDEVVLALCGRGAVPAWVRGALLSLPALMADATRRESAADGMARDLVEASVLAGCTGAELRGLVIKVHGKDAVVQVSDPAVVASVAAPGLAVGDEVRLKLAAADVGARTIVLDVVG